MHFSARRLGYGIVAAALVTLSACAPRFQTHGYAPDDGMLGQITVGVSDREAVAAAVGRPSVQGVLEQEAWYYVKSRFRHEGLRAPAEVSREVVAISFGPGGRVSNIERFGLEKGRAVVLSQRVTDSGIRGQSVLNQLLGNLGRIDTGDFFQSEL